MRGVLCGAGCCMVLSRIDGQFYPVRPGGRFLSQFCFLRNMLKLQRTSVIQEKNMADRRKNIPQTADTKPPGLDAIDRKILMLLQDDNQITNQDLASKV